MSDATPIDARAALRAKLASSLSRPATQPSPPGSPGGSRSTNVITPPKDNNGPAGLDASAHITTAVTDAHADPLRLRITFGQSAFKNAITSGHELPWSKFIALLRQAKPHVGKITLDEYQRLKASDRVEDQRRAAQDKDGAWFSMVKYREGATRAAANVVSVSAFVGDFDDGTVTEDVLREMLGTCAFYAVTTFSHSPACPKWRVIVPYSRPVTPDEHKRVFEYFGQLLPALDRSTSDPSRLFYMPGHVKDGAQWHESFENEGEHFDPEIALAAVAAGVTGPLRPLSPLGINADLISTPSWSLDDEKSILAAIRIEDRDGARRDPWLTVGMGLRERHRADPELGLEAFDQWSQTQPSYRGPEDVARTWWSLEPDGGVTFGTVVKMARDAGWEPAVAASVTPIQFGAPDSTVGFGEPELRDPHFVVTKEEGPDGTEVIKKTAPALPWNLMRGLAPGFLGEHVQRDAFKEEITLKPAGRPGRARGRAFQDEDYMRILLDLENKKFSKITREVLKECIHLTAKRAEYDSMIDWLESLPPHDGVPHVERFLPDYFGTADTSYARAVSRYLWTALAGRVLAPGIKADMVPILSGSQGLMKTEGLMAMLPSEDLYVELALKTADADMARLMRGTILGEIAELGEKAMGNVEDVKKFVSRRRERHVGKYREFATNTQRRTVLVGTTNEDELLIDPTGHRRWLPIIVGRVDVDAIKCDRLMLWAEAREMFKTKAKANPVAGGIAWEEAERLAPSEHDKFLVDEVWIPDIRNWLDSAGSDGKPRSSGAFALADLFRSGYIKDLGSVGRREQLRAGRALRLLGYEKRDTKAGGVVQKLWTRSAPTSAAPSTAASSPAPPAKPVKAPRTAATLPNATPQPASVDELVAELQRRGGVS